MLEMHVRHALAITEAEGLEFTLIENSVENFIGRGLEHLPRIGFVGFDPVLVVGEFGKRFAMASGKRKE